MILSKRERARAGGSIAHCTCCDISPCMISLERKRLKRRDRQAWKRDVREGRV